MIETDRLVLRRPHADDAHAMFDRYASDPQVTRFVGWRTHQSIDDTKRFLAWSDTEWERWGAGPYMIASRDTGNLLGCTGLAFETPTRASTGYVLAVDAWGQGYATETLRAMVDLARDLGVVRLYAICHPQHRPSARVLEKGGFVLEGTLRKFVEFPNLALNEPSDVLCYATIL